MSIAEAARPTTATATATRAELTPPTVPVAHGATALRAPQAAPAPPWLRLVPAVASRPARGPFAALVVAVLGAGLIALLLLNTVVSQDSFVLSDLQRRSATLADREEALAHQAAADASPQRLARRARALGLVPITAPAFLLVPSGRVLGDPEPGQLPPRPVPKPARKPAPTAARDPAPTTAPTPARTPAPAAPRVAKPHSGAATSSNGARTTSTSGTTASGGTAREGR